VDDDEERLVVVGRRREAFLEVEEFRNLQVPSIG
jgi:hypothetical protein